jgi:predicted transcriptional regulator
MKGKDLKQIIDDSGVKIADIVRDSGIPEQTLYSLYNKKALEKPIAAHYIEKLQKTGLKLQKTMGEERTTVDALTSLAHKFIERLDKDMVFHERHIVDLEKNNEALIKTSNAFVDTSKVLGRIVDMCLDAGALTVDKSKIVDVLSKLT